MNFDDIPGHGVSVVCDLHFTVCCLWLHTAQASISSMVGSVSFTLHSEMIRPHFRQTNTLDMGSFIVVLIGTGQPDAQILSLRFGLVVAVF